MDFGDSPEEGELHRLRAWICDHNPGLPPSSTATRTGPPRRTGTGRCTGRGLLRPVLARRGRRPWSAERLRRDPRRRAGLCRCAPAPDVGYLVQGLLRHGSADVQRRFLPGLRRAGGIDGARDSASPTRASDLASLRTLRRPGGRRVRHYRGTRSGRATPTRPSGAWYWPGTDPDVSQAPRALRFRGTDASARDRAASAQDDQRRHTRVWRGDLRWRPSQPAT